MIIRAFTSRDGPRGFIILLNKLFAPADKREESDRCRIFFLRSSSPDDNLASNAYLGSLNVR